MDRYVVFGNPIAHSKSPVLHRLFAEQTGQAMQYDTLLAPWMTLRVAPPRFSHKDAGQMSPCPSKSRPTALPIS